jgi:hypothetical protein
MMFYQAQTARGARSLAILVCWVIWCERVQENSINAPERWDPTLRIAAYGSMLHATTKIT